MSLVNSERKPYMSERYTNNALRVENFSLELGEEVNDVQLKVAAIRKKIDENRGSHENFNGFLIGQIDDYLDSYDAQVAKINQRLQQDKAYWQEKAKQEDANKEKQTDALMKILAKAQLEMAHILFDTPKSISFDLKSCPIKDLERFGQEAASNDSDFRWPTQADLEKMNLAKPPTLIEIRTSGSGWGLASIQLIFEDGIESPLFDSKATDASPIASY